MGGWGGEGGSDRGEGAPCQGKGGLSGGRPVCLSCWRIATCIAELCLAAALFHVVGSRACVSVCQQLWCGPIALDPLAGFQPKALPGTVSVLQGVGASIACWPSAAVSSSCPEQ